MFVNKRKSNATVDITDGELRASFASIHMEDDQIEEKIRQAKQALLQGNPIRQEDFNDGDSDDAQTISDIASDAGLMAIMNRGKEESSPLPKPKENALFNRHKTTDDNNTGTTTLTKDFDTTSEQTISDISDTGR